MAKTITLLFTRGPFLPEAARKVMDGYTFTHVNTRLMAEDEEGNLKRIPATNVLGQIPEGLYDSTPKHKRHEALCKALGIEIEEDTPVEDETDASGTPQDEIDADNDSDDDENEDEDVLDVSEMTVEQLDKVCEDNNFTVAKKDRKTIGKYRTAVAKALSSL